MDVKELITKFETYEPDLIVIFTGSDGGWTNVEVVPHIKGSSTVCIVPASNREN